MNKKLIWVIGGTCATIAIVITIILSIVLTNLPMEKYERVFYDDSKITSTKNCFYEKWQTHRWERKVYSTNIEDFTGVKKIKSVNCEDNQVFNINLNISSGQFKLVLINRETKNIIEIANETCIENITTQISAGDYDIKIVGIHAKFNLKLDCNNLTII